MKIFATRLKELRNERNLSTTQLASEIKCSAMAISRWERDLQNPSIEVLVALAKFFNVSTDYLCGLED